LVAGPNRQGGVRLADLLSRDVGDKPFVLVAASGGGTRAAVFTGVILEALHPIGGERFIGGSGVSGGAAALAIYAGTSGRSVVYRAEKPFIKDVIERSVEWRMIAGGRLGTLLAESFERRWYLNESKRNLSQVPNFGLIFNTTLAGHFQRLPGEQGSLEDLEARHRSRISSADAGERLLITNLDLTEAFDGPKPKLVTNGDIPLTRAAALASNFPPVFANAAIDVDNTDRYWVTDGGAADNSGLEMLLYAVRHAIKNRQGRLPKIHIVVIDASAVNERFAQTRGLGSALGAGARFAAHLHAELRRQLQERYNQAGQENDFQITPVEMPTFMRVANAIGTHWMMQPRIDLRIGDETVTFHDYEVTLALSAAYADGKHNVPAILLEAIKASPEFSGTWPALLKAIR
jgi:hypothetical protein